MDYNGNGYFRLIGMIARECIVGVALLIVVWLFIGHIEGYNRQFFGALDKLTEKVARLAEKH